MTENWVASIESMRSTALVRSNLWDTQLAIRNDPRYARLETNLGIGKDRFEAFAAGSPRTNTIVITSEIESGFVAKKKTTWFYSAAAQFSRARYHSKRRHRWVGVKGSTHNGRRDLKCPSARRFCMVQKDTWGSEGVTCAWMAVDEAVGCTRAFLSMWRSS
ncbi:uncharacterized protein TNCV_2661951 [Trichonephila clavipes]|nr:uncharacterized protein TNCV_2661951 [Trichonephila clavipes]